jgi:hypothetical protein
LRLEFTKKRPLQTTWRQCALLQYPGSLSNFEFDQLFDDREQPFCWTAGENGMLSGERTDGTSQADPRQVLVNLAIESWRFARLFARVLSKLDAGEAQRFAGQLRYFQKGLEDSLEAAHLKIVNLEGHPYDPGIAASALNIGDFAPDDLLIVGQMIEPIIMDTNGLVRPGTVMLQKVEK